VNSLLGISRFIDGVSDRVGKTIYWLVLAAVLISAGNAVVRKAFNMSSNAFLEIQWYLFAAIFLLCAGYTLMNKEHVRIDVISSHLSKTKQIWIDIIGLCFFLIPFCVLVVALSWPLFVKVYVTNEMSSNAGGLIRWPVYALMPLGFTLLFIQGISELIKRFAFLKGLIPDPTLKTAEKTAEEELAEAILKAKEKEEKARGISK
jgi:TRAP-type mannitol/chloroaromatic compound transport system permease small subunit